MKIEEITSLSELKTKLNKHKRTCLLIYKKGSSQSTCAYEQFLYASKNIEGIQLFSVDVTKVKDVHPEYNITSAPTLLEFKGNETKRIIKGCHDSKYFTAFLDDAALNTSITKSGKAQKNVIVYSTPSCSWCNTLKSYLKQHKIKYREVDVSRDQAAAQAMVNKSGQQGVPQTEINGKIIVGFDKKSLNTHLDIKG